MKLSDKIKDILKYSNCTYHFRKGRYGEELLIMSNNGAAFMRILLNGFTSIELEGLSVSEEFQRQGYGTVFVELFGLIGSMLRMETLYLTVDRTSWVYDWYKELGYKEKCNTERVLHEVWMFKKVDDD